MKRLFITILLLSAAGPLFAQVYHPGEVLEYRASYKAKMFPNTEVGVVEVKTTEVQEDGKTFYKVVGVGRTLPTYRWFYKLEDTYTIWVDGDDLRTARFESDVREGDYTFRSSYIYDWVNNKSSNKWQSRNKPEKQKVIELSEASMDPISLYFNMRAADRNSFKAGEPAVLQMLLQDTIRHIQYKFIGREAKKIRNMGKFNTMKFICQIGTSEGFSFTDGSVFTLWISDDENMIPLYIETPVKVGSIQAYISGYKGLKYPLTSLVK